MKQYRYRHRVSRQGAIALSIISVLMVLVFFGAYTVSSSVDINDTEKITADFERCEFQYGRNHSLLSAHLFFENGKEYTVDGVCVNEELVNSLEALKKGTTVSMLKSNSTESIVQIKVQERELLSFDYAQKKLRQEGMGFLVFSVIFFVVFCYFLYEAITTKEVITKADLKLYWDIMRKK